MMFENSLINRILRNTYLKNSNPTGGADISVAQFLRFPKDLSGGSAPFLPVGDPATAAVITGGTLGQFTITKPYGNSNIVINGSLKPQQSIDVAVPLAYDGIGSCVYERVL